MKEKSFSKTVYKDVASFGRTMSFIGAIISTIIAILLIILGIYFVVKNIKYSASVKGTVKSVDGSDSILCKNVNNMYNCTFEVDYKIPNSEGEKIVFNNLNTTKNYQVGDNIDLYYDPNDVNTNLQLNKDDNRVFGWVLIVIAIFMIILSWLWNYLVYRSKFLAATEGVATGLSIISSPFRK